MKRAASIAALVTALLILLSLLSPALCEEGGTQTVKTSLFSVTFPSDDWVSDMARFIDKPDYCTIWYRSSQLMVDFTVTVCHSDVIYYRNRLREIVEIADQPVVDQKCIGGVTFAYAEGDVRGRHSLKFASRIPESNVSLLITVYLAHDVQYDVQPILDSIIFTLPTFSPALNDPPLPEDGAPYHPQPGSARIGNKEIKAAWLPMDTPLPVESSFAGNIAYSGDTLYALTGRRLYAYSIQNGKLVSYDAFPDGVLKLDEYYPSLSITRDGTLFATSGFNKTFSIRDGAITKYDDHAGLGELAMHPSGEWGIYYHSSFLEKVHLNESGMTVEKWVLESNGDSKVRNGYAEHIQCLSISDDRIYAAMQDEARPDIMTVSAFDFDGRELFALGSPNTSAPDMLDYVTNVVQTQNSIVIMDINTLKVFSLDGSFLGAVNCNELLGTHNGEIASITPAEDGIYLSAAQTREDRSCTELLIFHVTGI